MHTNGGRDVSRNWAITLAVQAAKHRLESVHCSHYELHGHHNVAILNAATYQYSATLHNKNPASFCIFDHDLQTSNTFPISPAAFFHFQTGKIWLYPVLWSAVNTAAFCTLERRLVASYTTVTDHTIRQLCFNYISQTWTLPNHSSPQGANLHRWAL